MARVHVVLGGVHVILGGLAAGVAHVFLPPQRAVGHHSPPNRRPHGVHCPLGTPFHDGLGPPPLFDRHQAHGRRRERRRCRDDRQIGRHAAHSPGPTVRVRPLRHGLRVHQGAHADGRILQLAQSLGRPLAQDKWCAKGQGLARHQAAAAWEGGGGMLG